jgi:hypothetical protein
MAELKLEGLNKTLKKLDQIQKGISERKTRRQIMRKPAKVVVDAAKPAIPTSSKIHYRYNTPKLIKGRRAKKGSGVIVAAYVPGNLRKSIKRLNFRRSAKEWIGPKLSKRGAGKDVFGLNETKVDGYYATFIAKGAANFRRRFLEPALAAKANEVLKLTELAVDKELGRLTNKTGLGK